MGGALSSVANMKSLLFLISLLTLGLCHGNYRQWSEARNRLSQHGNGNRPTGVYHRTLRPGRIIEWKKNILAGKYNLFEQIVRPKWEMKRNLLSAKLKFKQDLFNAKRRFFKPIVDLKKKKINFFRNILQHKLNFLSNIFG